MATYSAWFVTKRGHPAQALQLKTDLPIPTKLPRDHVLIKVQAVALNPVDYKIMRALPSFIARRPHVAGMEFAGVVVEANGTEFSSGDKVFGPSTWPRPGVLAEYVVLPTSSLAKTPPNVSAVEAAGVSIVTMTAYQGLVKYLHVESGQTVFVNGGSSGVGSAAIQICKSMGCKVVATASAKNKDLLLSLGVDEFIDYTAAPLVEQLLANPPSPKFHALYDAVGLTDPALYLNCASYLAPGGMYLSAGTLPHSWKEFGGLLRQAFEGHLRPAWLGGVPRKFGAITVDFGNKEIEACRDLIAKGAVKPVLDSVHLFDQEGVTKAFEKLMTSHAKGKVVIKVSDDE
ncbi:Quinone oxidoreductase [Mycena sanguinolenta]|uniref:Quinone oxidoreductase n=1 Tax=Mycena sanguinolenta TaxID=230812 RepID=A0A8H7DBZ4_9AGAR|nr:Quinone oxidoreductase [Mycena sanguinolenta]